MLAGRFLIDLYSIAMDVLRALILAAAVGAALLASGVGRAAGDDAPGVVVEVVDGDTVILDDGREIRLVGIQAPKLPLGRRGFQAWPLADEAKRALEELVRGRSVTLTFGGRRMDRHGRWLAHLTLGDGTWVQGTILERGMARVYTFADNRARAPAMFELERSARAAGRGIWADPFYAVRDPIAVAADIGSFQLVVGTVVDAAIVRGRAYLNFGSDWRTDFTVSIAPDDRDRFVDAGFDPLSFEGRTIRVRGWVKSLNGPMIDATHPEQIELLDAPR